MNICVLTHTFPRNNSDVSAAFMKDFCDALRVNKNKVSVVAPFDPLFSRHGDRFKIYLYRYIWPNSLYRIGYSRTMEADVKLKKSAYLLIPFMILFGSIKLFQVVKREKIDLINAHWILPNGLIALIVSKITGLPYAITLPGTDTYLIYRYPLFRLIAKLIAVNASGIYSNSSFHLNRVLSLGIKGNTAVISYPADVKIFKPSTKGVKELKRKYGITNEIVVLAVGRLVYKKGFNYLIRSINELKDSPIKVIIGGDGDLKINLLRLIQRLGLENKIFMIGTIDRREITHYYNLADMVVSPSIVDRGGNVDGGPVVALESMACGKPQILTSILGMADVIDDGVNGFVVPEKNSKALSQAIRQLVDSKALRKKMGQANTRLVRKELSIQNIGKIYTSHFKEIFNEK